MGPFAVLLLEASRHMRGYDVRPGGGGMMRTGFAAVFALAWLVPIALTVLAILVAIWVKRIERNSEETNRLLREVLYGRAPAPAPPADTPPTPQTSTPPPAPPLE